MKEKFALPTGVLFDFDGVVVDSEDIHVYAWDEATSKVLGEPLSAEFKKTILGHSTSAIARMIAPNNTKVIQDLIMEKRESLKKNYGKVPLIEGIREFMNRLTSEAIPFGIASNSPRSFVSGVLDAIDLQVGVVLGVEDAQRPKPAPDLYLACAKKLEIKVSRHSEILVFEDSFHGVEAIKAAGMIPVGVTSQHKSQDLLRAGAKYTIQNFKDFPPWA